MRILLGMCLLAVSALASPRYDCRTMVQLGRTSDDAQTTDCPVAMMVDKTSFRAGDKVTVTVTTNTPITTFMLQARMAMDEVPQGKWEVPSSLLLTTHECTNPNDTVISIGYSPTETFTASWVAPLDKMVAQIEFVASVANADSDFWTDCNSILIQRVNEEPVVPEEEEGEQPGDEEEATPATNEQEEPANPSEDPNDQERIDAAQRNASLTHDQAGKETENKPTDPNQADEDLHDSKREEEQALQWQIKMAQLTDTEDAESEGEWTRAEEAERKQHEKEIHDEMMEYEERLEKEEEERQNRIKLEIQDKEEWDRKKSENKPKPGAGNENEVNLNGKQEVVGDGESGASAFAVSFTLVVLTLFAYCLP